MNKYVHLIRLLYPSSYLTYLKISNWSKNLGSIVNMYMIYCSEWALLHFCLIPGKITTFFDFFFFFFLPYQFWKKIRIYQVWFLFGVIPGVDSYSRHFGTSINNKMVSKTFKCKYIQLKSWMYLHLCQIYSHL